MTGQQILSIYQILLSHLLFRNFSTKPFMTAYLLTVGDEILIGQITDTNSAWMAQQLNLQGIRIVGRTSVGDLPDEIVAAIGHALSKADLVLMTGGLGATKDDITKKAIADFYGVPLVWHQETYDRMDFFFKKLGRTVSDMNKNACVMPTNAVILNNDRGLAPAMWIETNADSTNTQATKILVSMPGVPHEMMHLMSDRVLPRLRASFPMSPIVHRTILTAGEGETVLAEKLTDFENQLPSHIKLAYLPALGTVRLRLTARGDSEAALIQEIDAEKTKLEAIVRYAVAGYDDDTMPKVIGKMLTERQLRMATAESCTGGYLSHLITAIAGSSRYFIGGMVAYDNDLKINNLYVMPDTLDANGAVSEQTVREMVKGAVEQFGADVAIATSGIAGPSGGTAEKPVGTVWVAAGDSETILTYKISIDRGRQKNIEYAASVALNLLRKFLLAQDKG
jgi:nicotinamide-nucleotide amidase